MNHLKKIIFAGLVSSLFNPIAACAFVTTTSNRIPGMPEPYPRNYGGYEDVVRAQLNAQYHYGSCVAGTFASAATTVLAIRGVYLKPNAQFWFHNGYYPDGRPAPQAAASTLRGVPGALAREVLATIRNNDHHFYSVYTGRELVQRFGYRPC